MREQRIDLLLDATHPYAAQISRTQPSLPRQRYPVLGVAAPGLGSRNGR
jgi:hypothetical protein